MLQIADYMLDVGNTLMITTDASDNKEVNYSKEKPIITEDLVVLVNGYSASASEILTAALKESANAKIVGTTTYGKGVIQGIYLLKDNKTGVKVTIQEYFTPKRNKINKQGIKPDYEVELPEELQNSTNIEQSKDIQLQKAIELIK